MTLKSRITERGINAMLIGLLFLGTGMYSCVVRAQGLDRDPMSLVKNGGKSIYIDPQANVEAQAVALNLNVNSPFAELKPAAAPNGTRLYFSRSLHPSNTGGETDMEDIWYSEFDKATSTWSEPIRMPGFLNNDGPNFITNISETGDTIVLGNQYGKNGKMKAGLSYSVNVNGQWSMPTPIRVQNDYNMSNHESAFVALRSGIILMAIQRAESFGGRDLYVSFWNGVEATEPVNMGNVINTEFEESSPYLAADNKTLYFASKGHNGYGGYDIYVSKRLDESWTNWSKPANLGPALNGSLDDEFFTITHCGKYAIFSKQVSVHNVDLFKISIKDLFTKPVGNENRKDEKSVSAFAGL